MKAAYLISPSPLAGEGRGEKARVGATHDASLSPSRKGSGRTAALALIASLAAVPALAAPDTARQAELTRLVRQDCGSCHGMTLKGGLGNPLLPESLHDQSDSALAATILDGRPGTPMPPWRGLLSEDDVEWIVHYLKEEGHD